MLIEKRDDSINTKKGILPNQLLKEILLFFRLEEISKNLLLNKNMYILITNNFQSRIVSSKEENSLIIANGLSNNDNIVNVEVSVKIKESYQSGIILMLEIFKDDQRLGLIPLIYKQNREKFIININDNRYKQVFSILKMKNYKQLKFRVELMTSFSKEGISVIEIEAKLLIFNYK
jgi:hypothetical protein